MNYRNLGKTDLKVSELGFGAWAIGGAAYGPVDERQALQALARAEELGCNFVDSAAVYGSSERILGSFLSGRRSKWIVATKYSGQKEGLTATVERQLKRLRTDRIDFYQLHWVPGRHQRDLYDEFYRLKRDGKVRFLGASLYSVSDIDMVLDNELLDGFQVCFSLLDPLPFLARLGRIRKAGPAVIIRSCLKQGFLTGKFTRNSSFQNDGDLRRAMTAAEIAATVSSVEQFRFIEKCAGSMSAGAVGYALSYPEVSTVILGTKSPEQAMQNFAQDARGAVSKECLSRISKLQSEMGLRKRSVRDRLITELKRLAKYY